jgi:hypothetical protein
MHWNAELAYSIVPERGPVRPLTTLLDANRAILDDVPSKRGREKHWMQAKQLLLIAAETGIEEDVRSATDALFNALAVEGWITWRRDRQ